MAGYIPRCCTCPQTVTHPNINRAWRRVDRVHCGCRGCPDAPKIQVVGVRLRKESERGTSDLLQPGKKCSIIVCRQLLNVPKCVKSHKIAHMKRSKSFVTAALAADPAGELTTLPQSAGEGDTPSQIPSPLDAFGHVVGCLQGRGRKDGYPQF